MFWIFEWEGKMASSFVCWTLESNAWNVIFAVWQLSFHASVRMVSVIYSVFRTNSRRQSVLRFCYSVPFHLVWWPKGHQTVDQLIRCWTHTHTRTIHTWAHIGMCILSSFDRSRSVSTPSPTRTTPLASCTFIRITFSLFAQFEFFFYFRKFIITHSVVYCRWFHANDLYECLSLSLSHTFHSIVTHNFSLPRVVVCFVSFLLFNVEVRLNKFFRI